MIDADCIVPAAGHSSRMGAWKPLARFGSSTMIETVVANALAACTRVILVTGYRGPELASMFCATAGVVVVDNPDWQLGMFASVRRGAAAVASRSFFVTPGDMPWITAPVYQALSELRGADAAFPVFRGRRGHPVLFSRAVREAVLAADPSAGRMRDIAERFTPVELAWEDDTIHRDVDTMEDLA